MNNSIAVVIGVGASSGLGAALARRFASEGLTVYLGGRTLEKLQRVADEISQNGGCAVPYVVDATNEQAVIAFFAEIMSQQNSELLIVACNVDSNQYAPLLETSAEMFTQLWMQNAFAGFLVGREAAKYMSKQEQGTLFFTGASASLRARPPFTAFSSAKSALRHLAQGMAREFGKQGIHVVHTIIDGVIDGERARKYFPDFVAQKNETELLNLDAIADTYWHLHCQPKSVWTHELDLRPYKEPF
jgi:NAD(P)-dependent dehydrogenase (short-subunit alcohol dehydrogenase family)